MTTNLLNDVTAFLGPDRLERLEGPGGEPPGQLSRAAKLGLPALIGGLGTAGSTEAGASSLMSVIRSNHYDDDGALDRIRSMVGDPSGRAQLAGSGGGILRSIFGGRLDGMLDGLSGRAGIERSSMSGLLAMFAPIVLGVLGKKVREDRLDERGLASLLGSQRSLVGGLTPEGFAGEAEGQPLCAPKTFEHAPAAREVRREPVAAPAPAAARVMAPVAAPPRKMNWLWPLLAVGLLAALLFFLFRGIGDREDHVAVGDTPTRAAPAGKPDDERVVAAPVPIAPVVLDEPVVDEPVVDEPVVVEQEEIAVTTVQPEGGIDAFATALAADDVELPSRFVFEDLHFEHASAGLAESASLDRVADLMREHSSARIRVDGHTDSTGDAALNSDLSQSRAYAVRSALVSRGIDGSRIEAAGHGADSPLATNATAEGRRQNRRTEITLLAR